VWATSGKHPAPISDEAFASVMKKGRDQADLVAGAGLARFARAARLRRWSNLLF